MSSKLRVFLTESRCTGKAGIEDNDEENCYVRPTSTTLSRGKSRCSGITYHFFSFHSPLRRDLVKASLHA